MTPNFQDAPLPRYHPILLVRILSNTSMPTPTLLPLVPKSSLAAGLFYAPLTPLSMPFLPLCQQFMFRPTLEVTSPTRGWGTGVLPNTTPSSHSLCRDTAALLCHCCTGKRTFSQKWMCCSLRGSPLSPHWRTLTSQTGLERCRKDARSMQIWPVLQRKGQSIRDNDATTSLVRAVNTGTKCQDRYGLSIPVEVQSNLTQPRATWANETCFDQAWTRKLLKILPTSPALS